MYDLLEDKHKERASYKAVQKNKLTHIRFSEHQKVILVGDDKGGVNMILPHPRLIMAVEKKKGQDDKEGDGKEKKKAGGSVAGLSIPPGLEDGNIGFGTNVEKKDDKANEGKKDRTQKEKETDKMDELLKQIYKDTAFA